MFSTIVAWIGFIGGCVTFLIILLDSIVNRRRNELEAMFYKRTYFNKKMLFIVLVWFASGVYLFG